MNRPSISEADAISCVRDGRRLDRRGYQGSIHISSIGEHKILVSNGMHPCLLNFGVSAIWRSGLHPFNLFCYKFSRQHDLNAWLKHKYNREFHDFSSTDADLYRPMRIEKMSRTLKRAWFSFKNALAS